VTPRKTVNTGCLVRHPSTVS